MSTSLSESMSEVDSDNPAIRPVVVAVFQDVDWYTESGALDIATRLSTTASDLETRTTKSSRDFYPIYMTTARTDPIEGGIRTVAMGKMKARCWERDIPPVDKSKIAKCEDADYKNIYPWDTLKFRPIQDCTPIHTKAGETWQLGMLDVFGPESNRPLETGIAYYRMDAQPEI